MAEYIVDGGKTSTGIDLYENDSMYIYDLGKANETTLNYGGVMYVSAGGSASETAVNSGGELYVSAGGTATQIRENGGYVEVMDGATAEFVANTFGGSTFSNPDWPTVHSGTVASDLTLINGACLEIFSAGIASNTTLNGGGSACVSVGGSANVATVNSGGNLFVYAGGTATQIKENGGCVDVKDGATVEFVPNTFGGSTFSDYGWHTVHSGTVASDLTLENDACLEIYSGGIASSITLNYGGEALIYGNGVANGITVRDGGNIGVDVDGKLTGKMTFEAGALFYAEIGAVLDFDLAQTVPDAETALVNNLSFILFEPFSYTLTADGTQENGTYKLAEYAADFGERTITVVNASDDRELGTISLDGKTLYKHGKMYTLSLDGPTLAVTVDTAPDNIFYGDVENEEKTITSPMSAVNVNVNDGGELTIYDGGVANNTVINENGCLNVSEGGVASNTTVNENGCLNISEGGVASKTIVNEKGVLDAYDGGVASDININAGFMQVYDGGSANSAVIEAKGELLVSSNGKAEDIKVLNGGRRNTVFLLRAVPECQEGQGRSHICAVRRFV
jgi:autotransporter passenger strand-loop-strand repeat protein